MKLTLPEAGPTPCVKYATPANPGDRRKEPRYVPVMENAYLGWWEGETFRSELGKLANISAGGAALEVAGEPSSGETVWLCVVGPQRPDWVPARLLGRLGSTARMAFVENLPYELFKTVVWGLPHDQVVPAAGVCATLELGNGVVGPLT